MAALQISFAEGRVWKPADAAALLAACAVIPAGTARPDAEYASEIQDRTEELIAVVDICRPPLGGEMVMNRKSVF